MGTKIDTLILAAGFGTRLYPLTKNTAKGLIKINNQPLINHTIKKINQIPEIETIYIVSNNKFFKDFLKWKEEFKHLTNKKIIILNNGVNNDSEVKGVLGDLKYTLKSIFNDDLLILGSDNLYCFDLNEIIKKAKEKQSNVTALKTLNKNLIKKYCCILLDKEDKITYFKEKPSTPKSNLISIFCYYLIKKDLDNIKYQKSFNVGNIIEYLYKDSNFYGYKFKEPWFDIGSLDELKKAEKFLDGK